MTQHWMKALVLAGSLGSACTEPRPYEEEPARPEPSDVDPDGSLSAVDAASTDAARIDLVDAMAVPDASSEQPSCGSGPLAESVTSHACLHAEVGPFRQVTASRSIASAPDVSRSHTHFAVTAPPEAGDLLFLRFETAARGEHAFFLREGSILDAVSANTGTRYQASPEWRTECALLPIVSLIDLREQGFYTIALRTPAATASFDLVIESLSAFGPEALNACSPTCDAGVSCGAEPECRSSGPCSVDSDCCLFCHDGDHCH